MTDGNYDFGDEVAWAGRVFDLARALKLSIAASVGAALVAFVVVWGLQYSPPVDAMPPAASGAPQTVNSDSPRARPNHGADRGRKPTDCGVSRGSAAGPNCESLDRTRVAPIAPAFVPPVIDLGPTLIAAPEPSYPPRAREREREGFVVLEFTVAADGYVKDIVVISSQPRGVFDGAAINALEQRRYAPRRINNRPVDSQRIRTVFEFRLE